MVTRVTGQVGALAGDKDTVQVIPIVWTGGHWVRCLLGPLVKSGDVSGALGSVARFTDPVQRGFHTRVSVALQTMEGDVSGARDTVEMISPEEGHRKRALSIIAEAEVRRGRIHHCTWNSMGHSRSGYRAQGVVTIIAAQARTQGAEAAQRSFFAMGDESFKDHVRTVMEERHTLNGESLDLLGVARACLCASDTFA